MDKQKSQNVQHPTQHKQSDSQRSIHGSKSQQGKVSPDSLKAARSTALQFKQAMKDLADR